MSVRSFFKTEPESFTIVLPIDWSQGRPSVVVFETPSQYCEWLPKMKDSVTIETFTWLLWNFGAESWIRENSMSSDAATGNRYLDQSKFRENKIRYLLLKWSLTNAQGVVEPLERTVVQNRPSLTEASFAKAVALDSNLMFIVLAVVDKVLNGILTPKDLYAVEDFKAFLDGVIPEHIKAKMEPSPTAEVAPKPSISGAPIGTEENLTPAPNRPLSS